MNENLLRSLKEFVRFSEDELSLLSDRLEHKKFKKDEMVLRPGEVCQSIYFVVSGAFRQYKLTEDMDEVTVGLYVNNDWMMNHRSFTSQKPSGNLISACTDSEVLALNIYNIHALIGLSQTFFQLGKILESVAYANDPYKDQIKPELKYGHLMSNKPLVVQLFPLKYIASYLQITPETLSRVRKKISISGS
jgi:signal-transduction protein with cAMP-binding, CBS, and nucleotidyltransferase domain